MLLTKHLNPNFHSCWIGYNQILKDQIVKMKIIISFPMIVLNSLGLTGCIGCYNPNGCGRDASLIFIQAQQPTFDI